MKKYNKEFYKAYNSGIEAYLTFDEARDYYSKKMEMTADPSEKKLIEDAVYHELSMIKVEAKKITVPTF